jgi:hypothetical protein
LIKSLLLRKLCLRSKKIKGVKKTRKPPADAKIFFNLNGNLFLLVMSIIDKKIPVKISIGKKSEWIWVKKPKTNPSNK